MDIDPGIKAHLSQYGDWHLLGRGALGQTWRVRQVDGTGFAVVKIRPLTEAARRAVKREADLMRRLRHPGLQRFVSQQVAADRLILVYDYIEGPSLAEELKNHGTFSVDTAIRIMVQVLKALRVIHEAGFIHRDISPQNVILRQGRDPVLIDFNAIGQLTESSNLGMTTRLGEYAGKPLYMTPEQLLGAPQGTGVDIWAIGAVLFEMVTGRTYRQATSIDGLVKSSMSKLSLAPDIEEAPAKLHGLLGRFLSNDPAQRPTVTEALAGLEALLPETDNDPFADPYEGFGPLLDRPFGGPANAPPAAAPPPPPASPDPFFPVPPVAAPPRAKSTGRTRLIMIVLLAGLLPAAGLYLALLASDSGSPPDPSAPPLWDRLAALDLTPLAYLAAGVCLIGLGLFAASRLRQHASEVRVGLPFQAVQLISGPDARERLTETICFQIDAYREAAGQGPDQMLTLTMVALAKEFADADSSDQRLKALQMLHELHEKVAGRLRPWWLDYETLMARGISLASLAGGALVVFEGVQRLLAP